MIYETRLRREGVGSMILEDNTIMSLFENHPILVILGFLGGITRFTLEFIDSEYASVFGAAVGIPITVLLIKDHLALKRKLRLRNLIC